jgi:ubiquinone/menaquinone biosynthesis C-methylase UbiE
MSSDTVEKKGFAEGFWSDDEITEIFLDKQRKIIWNKDYWRNVLVPLLGLQSSSVILDVGCGLGFIGQSLAEFIPDGKVIGVDLDAKLVELARRISVKTWPNHAFDYRVGSAYDLPVDSDTADLAVCQCMLMHLDNPKKAIDEMQRATKKGGRVVAIEPDYASSSYYDTAIEEMNYSVNQRANSLRWELLRKNGKRKLGKGDDDIGTKIPLMFYKAGLRVTEVRCFDRVFWLMPPYQREGNDLELEQLLIPPDFYVEKLDMRGEFIAGGGTEEELKENLSLLRKEHEIRQRQVKEKTYISSVTQALVITVGEKI